jgi:hypothetical protein
LSVLATLQRAMLCAFRFDRLTRHALIFTLAAPRLAGNHTHHFSP